MKSTSYEEIIEKCKNVVDGIKRKEMYIDILYDASSSTRILKTRTEEKFVICPRLEGFVVRAYKNGEWCEFGVQNLEEINKAVKKLRRFKPPAKSSVQLHEFENWDLNKEIKVELPPAEIPIYEKVGVVRQIYSELQKADERVVNPNVVYLDSTIERIFVNNEGCTLRQKIPRIGIFLQPIVKEGNKIEYDFLTKDGEVGFELVKSITNEEIQQAVKNSLDLLNSEKAPSGTLPVILDSDMTGLMAHESFGHGLESDQIIRDRSYLKKYMGKSVASEICNICDSPAIGGLRGSFFFDDEGIRAKKTVLVEDGILKNVLHNRYTASAMNLTPGGNGRRESFAHRLHIRMTNTFFEPGDWKLEEMLEDIKYGVMAVRGFFGMEDPLAGGMQLGSKKGYLIENGEKTKLLKAIALSGNVLNVLNSIDAIGKGPIKFHGGTCGKGHEDYVSVCTGGPYVRAQKVVVSPG